MTGRHSTPPNFDHHAEAINGPTREPWTGEHDCLPRVEWVREAVAQHNAPKPIATERELVTWKETGFIVSVVVLAVVFAVLAYGVIS